MCHAIGPSVMTVLSQLIKNVELRIFPSCMNYFALQLWLYRVAFWVAVLFTLSELLHDMESGIWLPTSRQKWMRAITYTERTAIVNM